MLLYDYDRVDNKIGVLPAGNVFQPWDRPVHWLGMDVPITLGEQADEFDGGKSS